MSDTVPNAFLILLGQIGLFVVAFIYGLPLAVLNGEVSFQAFSLEAASFILAITLASFMMVANILIGWSAVRDAQSAQDPYPRKMFVIDLLVIFVLFGMNNIIIYALGADFSAFDPSTVGQVMNQGISAKKSAFTVSVLMLMTAVYLYLCRVWNAKYCEVRGKDMSEYQSNLGSTIALLSVFSVVAFIFRDHPVVTIVCTLVWGGSWIIINRGWIFSNYG